PTTKDLYHVYWVGNRMVAMYMWNIVSGGAPSNLFREYFNTDHNGVPVTTSSWPASANAAHHWVGSYDAFGWAHPADYSILQPFRGPNVIEDAETEATAYESSAYQHIRPGIMEEIGHRH